MIILSISLAVNSQSFRCLGGSGDGHRIRPLEPSGRWLCKSFARRSRSLARSKGLIRVCRPRRAPSIYARRRALETARLLSARRRADPPDRSTPADPRRAAPPNATRSPRRRAASAARAESIDGSAIRPGSSNRARSGCGATAWPAGRGCAMHRPAECRMRCSLPTGPNVTALGIGGCRCGTRSAGAHSPGEGRPDDHLATASVGR
jgi:hypothetical protein